MPAERAGHRPPEAPMSARDPLHAVIARLRAENDELRARVDWLEQMLVPPDEPFPRGWRLLPAETRLLALLLRRAPLSVRHDAIFHAVVRSPDRETSGKTVQAQICGTRRRLRELCPEATIYTVRYQGYGLSAASKAAIVAAIARAAAAGDPPPTPLAIDLRSPRAKHGPSFGGHA